MRVVKILVLVVLAAVAVFLALHARQFLNRRLVLRMDHTLVSFGAWAPVAVVGLILLSTVIPPLPLPVPLIEIAAGVLFGFSEGFYLVWIAQMIASLFAFWATRVVGQKLFKNLLENRWVAPFRHSVQEGGPLGVLLLRATMAAPFNSVSLAAGITRMKVGEFALATGIGVLIESTLYPWVGSILRRAHLSLGPVFIVIVTVGALGPIATYAVTKLWRSRRRLQEN
jgi:uncharacterized membrane protein YdjX (TVP38/TMEM64 family)